MSKCYLARCQQERKLIRREFNKWTKNLLLQIGLETISKNHFDFEINSFDQIKDEEKIPIDFDPNQICLFCINRQECLPNTNLTDSFVNEDENSPLDLSLKSTSNLNSRSIFDIQSDILPIYNPDEFFLSNPMNFDYLSQSIPNLNLFSTFSINQYQLNSSLTDDYITQLAKQMAYLRMIQEIENQRNNTKSKITTNSSAILTESIHVNQIINDIMNRTLNDIFKEQIKQQTRVSKQGELLFVKKQNNDDRMILKMTKQYKHDNQINLSSSSSSSTSSSSSIQNKNKSNRQSKNQSLRHISNRRAREIIPNSKVIIGMDGKQIRPKRGQYRRYESEQLAKAVAAVLSNEMSVHKAGSYFGVPHSTLEYKVKERNNKISTTKTKIELFNENKSMDYHDGKDSNTNDCPHSIDDENESDDDDDDEEIQSYNSIVLQSN